MYRRGRVAKRKYYWERAGGFKKFVEQTPGRGNREQGELVGNQKDFIGVLLINSTDIFCSTLLYCTPYRVLYVSNYMYVST